MTIRIFTLYAVRFCACIGLMLLCAAAPATLNPATLPVSAAGVRLYPTPFLAIGRTTHLIAAVGGLDIQSDLGFLGGFSGFVDAATGQLGFPGYRNHSIANFAFDEQKLVVQMHVPYPEGRKLRASAHGDFSRDDQFELLIQPRGPRFGAGHVYRIIGNALGQFRVDLDEPLIGQYHRPWSGRVTYSTMLWDPTGGWMARIAIDWESLGGKPANGDIWGAQAAVHYFDPDITAILSPSDRFDDTTRFARLRFDFDRRVNYRAHWITEEAQGGTFVQGMLLANGDTRPASVRVDVTLYQGANIIGQSSIQTTASAGATYFEPPDGARIRIPSHPADSKARDTVAHVLAYDTAGETIIYDQWVPYWQRTPGERDWLKERFGKDFTLNIGPLPSLGQIDFAIHAATLRQINPGKLSAICQVRAADQLLRVQTLELDQDGNVRGTFALDRFTDGTQYDLSAEIRDAQGKTLSRKVESFTRRIMPFETAPRAGLSDIVIAPFTAPRINGATIECWNRRYQHGPDVLLQQLFAAGENLLAGPAVFKARINHGPLTVLRGDGPQLTPLGKGKVRYHQRFSWGNLLLNVDGEFDYDGFYLFHAGYSAADGAQPVTLDELKLEIPIASAHATLIDAAVTWMIPGHEKALGLLSTDTGRIWDSHTLPYQEGNNRTSNMPPYLWIGDDDRGLCFSNASPQGAHNDAALPAAALDRSNDAVVMSIWLVNSPLPLTEPRQFEFALQASPFKPVAANGHLWRDGQRAQGPYKNGVYFTNFWNPANYPTYGRWLTLDYLKLHVQTNGCDRSAVPASALSECSGTPEYMQFYYEWGSPMEQFKRFVAPVPADLMVRFQETHIDPSPFVMVEAFSNGCKTNQDYRVWWMSEAAKHAGLSYIYQDNAPWVYTATPEDQYGYQRPDGGREPTSMIFNSRTFMKRLAHAMVEAGQPSQPAVWPNLMSPVLPGRSFCGKALTGEYTNSDQLPMGLLRVHLSKQWGIVIDWLCQTPSSAAAQIGTTRAYWRKLCSQIFLLDVTNISRADTAEITRMWYNALDAFWLDDPTLRWHAYYRNPTLQSVQQPKTTLVSTYTATDRLLAVISNHDATDVVETVRFKSPPSVDTANVKYYYDAESGEPITVRDGALRLFIPGNDYRLVLGFDKPWEFDTTRRVSGAAKLAPQSELDARQTLAQVCKQLLSSRTLGELSNPHRLTEAWAREIVSQLQADDVKYFDAKATATVDLGTPDVSCSVFYNPRNQSMLIGYYNHSTTNHVLGAAVRQLLAEKVGNTSFRYIYDAISGASQWAEIDVPAGQGRWEVCYPDNPDFYGPRHGVFAVGTQLGNMLQAVAERKKQMDKP